MAVKNLVSGVLAQSITTTTTNVLVNIAENIDASGIQSFFPTPPFYITIMPKNPTIGVANRLDSEILQVTAVGSDQSGNASLTCVRGQRDTTAKAFDVGSIVTVGVYADDAVFLGVEGSAVGNPAPWIESSDIKNGAITTDKIADNAVTSDKVDWATLARENFVIPAIKNVNINYQANYEQGKWTCDKAGLYLVYFYQKIQGAYSGHDFLVKIFKNNTQASYASIPLDWAGISTMALVSLAVGDVVKFMSTGGTGSVQTADGQAFIVRISN